MQLFLQKNPFHFLGLQKKANNPVQIRGTIWPLQREVTACCKVKRLGTDVVDNEQTRSHRDAAARPETALGSMSREIPVCSRVMALPLDMAYQGNHSTPCLCQRCPFLEDGWQIRKSAENNSRDGWSEVVETCCAMREARRVRY